MDYCPRLDVIVSADMRGMIEYWRPRTLGFPANAASFKFKVGLLAHIAGPYPDPEARP